MKKYISLSRKNLNFSFSKHKSYLVKANNSTCQSCNKIIDKYDLILDHKIPVKIGGPKVIWVKSNLWLLCRKCNSTKMSKDLRIIHEMVKKKFFSKGANWHILFRPVNECIEYYKKRFEELY